MKKRKYLSLCISVTTLGYIGKNNLTSSAEAKLKNFSISNINENNDIVLSTTSDKINSINLNFNKFNIQTKNMTKHEKDIEINFYAKIGENSYNHIKKENISLENNSETIEDSVQNVIISNDDLSDNLPSIDNKYKELSIKITINHPNIDIQSKEITFGLKYEQENTEFYGDGSDGIIKRTEDGIESNILHTESYIIEENVTQKIKNGTVIIHALDEILINGELICQSEHQGGSGGSPTSGTGGNGYSGYYIGAGGSGGDSNHGNSGSDRHGDDGEEFGGGGGGGGGSCNGGNEGGSGGNGGEKQNEIPKETKIDNITDSEPLNEKDGWSDYYDLPPNPSSSGAGGGAGGRGESGSNGNGTGGDGGKSGGLILLIAPKITINGSISVNGEDGIDGKDGGHSSNCSQIGAGGGGAGGSGGLIYLISKENYLNGKVLYDGGLGGKGGNADGWAGTGGDGARGKEGKYYNINVE